MKLELIEKVKIIEINCASINKASGYKEFVIELKFKGKYRKDWFRALLDSNGNVCWLILRLNTKEENDIKCHTFEDYRQLYDHAKTLVPKKGRVQDGDIINKGDKLYKILYYTGVCKVSELTCDRGRTISSDDPAQNITFWDKETAQECADKLNAVLEQYK